ncbi:T9SS type A sorting domain-containing protein [Candidatus Poribacteria bacterium]|nr:T9SS type A sorting domain-containing protein [Candidatus Poribacteria bacterium]
MKTELHQNYPNPFNPGTWISFQLSSPQEVAVHIYNVHGRLIRRIDLGKLPAGFYLRKDRAVYWNGRDETGGPVASGIYLHQLKLGRISYMKRMVIIK